MLLLWLFSLFFIPIPASGQFGFDEKYERDYNIFNPINRLRPDNPLNPINSVDPMRQLMQRYNLEEAVLDAYKAKEFDLYSGLVVEY